MVVDGKRFDDFGNEYRTFVVQHVHGRGAKGDFQAPTVGTAIPVGEHVDLFMLNVPPDDSAKLLSVVRFLDAIELHVKYESMYGESYSLVRQPRGDA